MPPSVTVRKVWLCLVLLRFAWTCLPQTGYIHPDEFFQSIEVASGLHTAVLFFMFFVQQAVSFNSCVARGSVASFKSTIGNN